MTRWFSRTQASRIGAPNADTLTDCGSAAEGGKDEPTTEILCKCPVSIDHGGYCERRVWGNPGHSLITRVVAGVRR